MIRPEAKNVSDRHYRIGKELVVGGKLSSVHYRSTKH